VETQELAGRRLGDRYLLQEPIASGGMATVWRATDEVLGRPVAVKILHDHLARDQDLLERFRLEAVAAARLSHPAVVRVFDTGVDEEVCYIVMELFEGQTFSDVIDERGPLPPTEAADLVGQALQGLGHAHSEGVIHRDVKPSNILVHPDAGVKVTDFGIAKAAFAGGDLTTTGNLLGTARYLAPEQVGGGEVDARTDLYSMGIVLYEALTGRTPFQAESHLATASMRLTKEPAPPGTLRPGLPRPVETVVLTALARDPNERYQSADEMCSALERAAPSPVLPSTPPRPSPGRRPVPTRPSFFRSWMLVPLVLLVLGAVAVAGVFLFDDLLAGGGPEQGAGSEAPVRPLRIDDASDFDPAGDGSEHPELAGDAFDGERTTYWQTEGYVNADMDKEGVGIFFDLGSSQEVAAIRLRTVTPGWRFEIRGSEDGRTFDDVLSSADGESSFVARTEVTRIELEPATYPYILVWVTELGGPTQPYRATVAEVDLYPAG
jgi:eukaryotic-like serine/threonine-protein kinase